MQQEQDEKAFLGTELSSPWDCSALGILLELFWTMRNFFLALVCFDANTSEPSL